MEQQLVLYHTGLLCKHSDLLQKRLDIYLNREPGKFPALKQAKEIVYQMSLTLEEGNMEQFGGLMTAYWQTLQKIGPQASNEQVESFYQEVKDLVWGAKMGTFSANRGFMLFLAREGKKEELKNKLDKLGGKVCPFRINHKGMEMRIITQ